MAEAWLKAAVLEGMIQQSVWGSKNAKDENRLNSKIPDRHQSEWGEIIDELREQGWISYYSNTERIYLNTSKKEEIEEFVAENSDTDDWMLKQMLDTYDP